MDGGTPNQPQTPWQFSNGTASAALAQSLPASQGAAASAKPAAPSPVTPAPAPTATSTSVPPAPAVSTPPAPVASATLTPTASPASMSAPASRVGVPDAAGQSQDVLDDDYSPEGYPEEDFVEWTASEFVAHHKSSEWYAMLAIITIFTAVVVYFLTKDILSGVVMVMLGSFAAYASNRQPKVLPYRLDLRGLTIGSRFYPYNVFKSFYLVDEGAFASITMMPSGGFMPELSIYFAPEDEQDIIEVLGEHLPMEQNQGTYVDRLVRRIRF